MQQYQLKKYLEFTVDKKPDKMKKHKIFANEPTGNLLLLLLLKKDINEKTLL